MAAEVVGKKDVPDNDDPFTQQIEVVNALTRLAASLKDLDDKTSAPVLSHYRHMPESVVQSYDLLYQGAQLVHGTSTKYTLLGKIDAKEQTRMTQDLLKGCQLLGTGCVVIHDNQTGCARSTREHCKKAVRSIVHTVIQLVEVWVDHEALGEGNNLGAQKTGAVWEMCDTILQKRLPLGNRNSMKRDLLTHMMECAETIREFQELIDEGPSLREAAEKEETGDDDKESDDWNDFLEGEDSQYSSDEIPIATDCLFLIKCSRGCINLSLQAIESVGERIDALADKTADGKSMLGWISKLHDLARNVGVGMTDLGASMYPPLDLEALNVHIERQASAIQAVLDFVVDAKMDDASGTGAVALELPDEINDLAKKIQNNLKKRREAAIDDIIHLKEGH